jgi:urea carboxylase
MKLRIEPGEYSLADYRRFLNEADADIQAFQARQRQAFHEERERWKASGQDGSLSAPDLAPAQSEDDVPEGAAKVASPVPGNVWKLLVQPGDTVTEGQTLAVVESMKMEFPVLAPSSGTVQDVRCREGGSVAAGQTVAVITPAAA